MLTTTTQMISISLKAPSLMYESHLQAPSRLQEKPQSVRAMRVHHRLSQGKVGSVVGVMRVVTTTQ